MQNSPARMITQSMCQRSVLLCRENLQRSSESILRSSANRQCSAWPCSFLYHVYILYYSTSLIPKVSLRELHCFLSHAQLLNFAKHRQGTEKKKKKKIALRELAKNLSSISFFSKLNIRGCFFLNLKDPDFW